ncbi:hypothetical protein COO60DRAFT_1534599, partial [Scenedesmus sp. NREL 46B-D3]
AYDVLMIDSLEPGCLWVWDKPWQPEQLAGLLLPEHCLDILAMPRGSLSKAMVRRFRYVYMPRMHLHDAPGYRSRLTFVFKELDVKAGNVCRTESLNGALAIDMLMQAAGQPPANFDRAEQRAQALDVIGMSLPELVESQAGRMRGCPNKQQHFLEVLRVAGASGRIPELQGWAALRAPPSGLDAGCKPSRAGSKRKLGDLDALSAKAQETGVVSWSCQEREQHLPDGVRLRVAGPWPERGRNYNKAGSSSSNSSETMCAVLYSEYAYDVLMIDSLEPGCLWVWDKPWQPEQLAGLLLPEHCLDILAMPRGSLSKVGGDSQEHPRLACAS